MNTRHLRGSGPLLALLAALVLMSCGKKDRMPSEGPASTESAAGKVQVRELFQQFLNLMPEAVLPANRALDELDLLSFSEWTTRHASGKALVFDAWLADVVLLSREGAFVASRLVLQGHALWTLGDGDLGMQVLPESTTKESFDLVNLFQNTPGMEAYSLSIVVRTDEPTVRRLLAARGRYVEVTATVASASLVAGNPVTKAMFNTDMLLQLTLAAVHPTLLDDPDSHALRGDAPRTLSKGN